MTAEQQQTNLTLMNQQIEEQLRYVENQSVVLSRQSSLNNVISGARSYYQVNSLTTDFSNVIYSNASLHSIEVYMENTPPHNIQSPVRYGELSEQENSLWHDLLNDRNTDWVGIREVEMIHGVDRIISYARMIRSSRGEIEAVLVLNLDPLIVENWLRSFESSSTLYLINEDNHILASTDFRLPGENYHLPFERDEENELNTLYQRVDDELFVTSKIYPYEWQLIGVTPYDTLTETSRELAFNMIIISMVIIAITIMITAVFTKKLTSPIRKLTNLMKEYQLKKTIQKIPDDYQNEFGQLFNVYKNLISRNEKLMDSAIQHYRQQKRAELKALQANINPHFLYNTLDQLNWRAIDSGDDEMSQMIELLGEMLRIGLSNGENIITIEEELHYAEKYLELQMIRYDGQFSYQINIEQNTKRYYLPKLTLQPFIENSIVHGLQEIKDGKITICVSNNGDNLDIFITDNGRGAKTFEKISRKKTGGYGIQNVKERLDNYFSYQAKLKLSNKKDGGVQVQLTIPKISNKEKLSTL